jgi:pilus assembly protein Flp/PilA
MMTMWNMLASLHKDETGQGLVEYLLILALVALAALAAMKSLGTAVSSAFSKIGGYLGSYIS